MMATLQDLLVYALVALCALYSVWVFLPAALKRRAAAALMQHSPRLAASRRLQKLSQQGGGCASGCGDCGSSPAKPVLAHKVRFFHRR